LEKRKAHYPLATVKRLTVEGRVSFTMTAVAGGALLIISFKEKDE